MHLNYHGLTIETLINKSCIDGYANAAYFQNVKNKYSLGIRGWVENAWYGIITMAY